MAPQTDARRAYVEHLMNRLRRLYADRAVLPRSDGRHVVASCPHVKAILRGKGRQNDELCTCVSGETMSLGLIQRLYRAIMSEGYGL